MGNTNFRHKPSDLLVVKSKDKWERQLFGRQNVTIPTAWKEAGFGEEVKINITEYVWLSERSPNTGLWKSFAKQHRWARELNQRIQNHMNAQTTPMKRHRVSRLQFVSKSFPRWYYNQTERAVYPWNVGGFDALVRDFLLKLKEQQDVTVFFASKQPLVYSQSLSVSSAISAATNLRLLYGDSFTIQETNTGAWALLNVGGKALWVKSVPVNGQDDSLYYQLTAVEKVKGQPKISFLSVETRDIPQSEILSVLQSALTPELLDVVVPIEGKVAPTTILQALNPIDKQQIDSSANTTLTISTPSLPLPRPPLSTSSTFTPTSFSVGNRSNQSVTVSGGTLRFTSLSNGSTLSHSSQSSFLLFDQLYYLTSTAGLSPRIEDAVPVTIVETSGVLVIRETSSLRIWSSVFLEWVLADENTDFHGWFSI